MFEMFLGMQSAWLEEQQRALRALAAVPRAFDLERDVSVGTTPHEVVFERGSLRLLRYRRDTPARYLEPVVFCYALINRPYILDLQADKSVVRRYLAEGFDIYLIDWGIPSDADRGLTLEHYVCDLLREVVAIVLARQRVEQLHLLGYCMGGTLSTMFTALYPELIKSLTLLAAPIDFASRDTLINVWADSKHFDIDAFVDANGNCPAAFLQACFLYLKPVQNLLEKKLTFFENIDDAGFVANFFAMEHWVNDNIPVASETFRQFVKKLYQNNELVRGALELGGRRVDLAKIVAPLLLLTAESDHLVPPESTHGIRPHVGSEHVRAMTIESGHVGLVVSGKAQRTSASSVCSPRPPSRSCSAP